MPQMTESRAESLAPAHAAELARVIDLQARWENLCGDRGVPAATPAELHDRQRAFEALRVRLAEYAARHRGEEAPDQALNSPTRLVAWCRTVRAVLRRAEREAGVECPADAVAKAYRRADRIAARLGTEPVGRGAPPDGVGAAIEALGAVILWCDSLPANPGAPEAV